MNKNGFITSALLYGILALFLMLMLGSLAVLANRKISMDNLKEAALNDVGSISGVSTAYNIWDSTHLEETFGYLEGTASTGTWTTNDPNPYFVLNTNGYQNIDGIYVSLQDTVTNDMTVIVSYSNSTTFTNSTTCQISRGNKDTSCYFDNGNYKYIKVQIGDRINLSYKVTDRSLIGEKQG